jgi:hypothetical protein
MKHRRTVREVVVDWIWPAPQHLHYQPPAPPVEREGRRREDRHREKLYSVVEEVAAKIEDADDTCEIDLTPQHAHNID